ncbi:MAG: 4-(cytidine 5'-diphospho)-2-C-methyl-D-erythritol kinase [Solirubrobacterales bacterium]|nr:4-(cytidine 5'-diphospho)-2-C-methyl-D-erythritol kinase [Solirubrobacterales bacterium]
MRAPAKINPCLFVGQVRSQDGRHELVSVMQAVDLADELRLSAAGGAVDEVHCPGVEGPNLVSAAVAAFRARTGWDGPPVRIDIRKRIPVAAGMAGGSADAAAALRLVAAAAGHEEPALLREIAAGLGADVPAQVRPGRFLATGAGERVEPLAPVWPGYAVLVLPSDGALSTPAVYAEFDKLGLQRSAADLAEREREVRAATARRPGTLPPELVVNDLAPAAVSLLPSVGEALEQVAASGADHALVSGSGPTVLGLYGDARVARTAAQTLRRRHPGLVLTEPVVSAPGRGA